MDASYRALFLSLLLWILGGVPPGVAAESAPMGPASSAKQHVDHQVQELLEQTLDLERDLRIAEDELVPVRQRLEIVVAVNTGAHFRLREMDLVLDGKRLVKHTYSPVEIAAFRNGASQRLYVGNPDQGQHRLTVHYAGRGGAGSVGSATLVFATGTAAQLVEVALNDRALPADEDGEPVEPAVELSLTNWVLPP